MTDHSSKQFMEIIADMIEMDDVELDPQTGEVAPYESVTSRAYEVQALLDFDNIRASQFVELQERIKRGSEAVSYELGKAGQLKIGNDIVTNGNGIFFCLDRDDDRKSIQGVLGSGVRLFGQIARFDIRYIPRMNNTQATTEQSRLSSGRQSVVVSVRNPVLEITKSEVTQRRELNGYGDVLLPFVCVVDDGLEIKRRRTEENEWL